MTADELVDNLTQRGCIVLGHPGRVIVEGWWEALETSAGWICRVVCDPSTSQGRSLARFDGQPLAPSTLDALLNTTDSTP